MTEVGMIPKVRVKLYLSLAALAALGGCVIAVSQYFVDQVVIREIVKELGVAALIAAALGLTVDQAMKAELVRDAFYAAFRYVLPEELKAEVARIIDYRFICTDHHSIVEVIEVGDGLVRVNISSERTLKNITRQTESIDGRFAIDEWGFPGRTSVIEQCTLKIGDQRFEAKVNSDYNQGDAIGWVTEKKSVKSNETAHMIVKGYEFHRTNSVLIMGYRAPSVRPVLDLHFPNGFKHRCSFGVPGERIVSSEITKRYTLDGAQFPSQNMWIRWWKDQTDVSASGQGSPS
jgi:hypothetical protein